MLPFLVIVFWKGTRVFEPSPAEQGVAACCQQKVTIKFGRCMPQDECGGFKVVLRCETDQEFSTIQQNARAAGASAGCNAACMPSELIAATLIHADLESEPSAPLELCRSSVIVILSIRVDNDWLLELKTFPEEL